MQVVRGIAPESEDRGAGKSSGLQIVGVGRSGTSIATRVCGCLGLRLPRSADLLPPGLGNKEGFWESESLVAFDDELLAHWGSTWWTPPSTVTKSMLQQLGPLSKRAARDFHRAFGTAEGWVWKDPRLTVLLPFWDNVIGKQPVLVPFRDPGSVAMSIARRDGTTPRQGLALWERHTRLLLAHLEGRRVLLASYESLCTTPDAWIDELVRFCVGSGLKVGVASPAVPRLVKHDRGATTDSLAVASATALFEILERLQGVHECFEPVQVPAESPWLEAEMEELRYRYRAALASSQ